MCRTMDGYRVFFSWRLFHEYYTGNVCRGIELIPDARTKELFRKRGAGFKKMAVNEWVLFGGDGVEWDGEDEVVLKIKVVEQDLWYVTVGLEELDELRVRPGEGEPGGNVEMEMKVKTLRWEYLLLARKWVEGQQLELAEASGRLQFSKPELVEVNGNKCWRTVTAEPVLFHETYDYQLRLTEQRPLGKRMLCKRVVFPEPGRYTDAPAGCVRQVVYY